MRDDLLDIFEYKKDIVLWGAGFIFEKYAHIFRSVLGVACVIDRNKTLVGKEVCGFKVKLPQEINSYRIVVIMIDSLEANNEIKEKCEKLGIDTYNYKDVLEIINPQYEESLIKEPLIDFNPNEKTIMEKYVGLEVTVHGCNLNCSYCYLGKEKGSSISIPKLMHSPKYIRYRLRRKIIGGSALITICASGETLLADKLSEICMELLKEGHVIIIVTNGISKKKISEIISSAGEYANHIIFKVSMHYMELRKRGLLNIFAENLRIIDESKASYTIELMPSDDLIEYIPEIMSYSVKNFGAYPQLTVGRDEQDGRRLLSQLEFDEYYKVWSVFNSEMFELKMKYYMMHGTNCDAGKRSFLINLETGIISRCLFSEISGNFFDNNCSLEFQRVGNNCKLDYCYNCHAYTTIGVLPDFPAPRLLEIRDRKRADGSHWLKEEAREFLSVKFYEKID